MVKRAYVIIRDIQITSALRYVINPVWKYLWPIGKHLWDGEIKYAEYSNVKNRTKYCIPNTLVNKLTMLAYFAEDPNINDERNDITETINIYSGLLYCLMYDSITS